MVLSKMSLGLLNFSYRGAALRSVYIYRVYIYIYIYIYSHFVKFLVVVDQVFSISQCRGHAILYTVTKNNVF